MYHVPMKEHEHSVLRPFMFKLPYRMQSVLMSAIRGCDTARKDDPSKWITRAMRPLILNNADPSNTFMSMSRVPEAHPAKTFLWDLDSYPMHFVMHLMHAAEIIGYKYQDLEDESDAGNIRYYWLEFYKKIVTALHLNPETEEQLDIRLGFTPAEKESIDAHAHKWDAGTGTSHGNRNRDWSGGS